MANITKVFIGSTAFFAVVSIALAILVVAEFASFQNHLAGYRLAAQAAEVSKVGALAELAKLEGERNNLRDEVDRLHEDDRTKVENFTSQIRNLQNQIADLEPQLATAKNNNK